MAHHNSKQPDLEEGPRYFRTGETSFDVWIQDDYIDTFNNEEDARDCVAFLNKLNRIKRTNTGSLNEPQKTER